MHGVQIPLSPAHSITMTTNKAKLEALLKLINLAAQEAIAEYEKVGGVAPSIDSTEPHPLDNAIDNLALKSAIRTLEGACAQLCTTLAPPSHTVINVHRGCPYPITQMLTPNTFSSCKHTTPLVSVLLSERRYPISSWITLRASMLTSSPKLSKSTQRSSHVCCVFWPPEVATTKVGHVASWSMDPTFIRHFSGGRHFCK